jgi:hypothetical protein
MAQMKEGENMVAGNVIECLIPLFAVEWRGPSSQSREDENGRVTFYREGAIDR